MSHLEQQGQTTVVPLSEALKTAERLRSEGRLTEAEALCRRVLAAQADSHQAVHLLGVIVHQNGKLSDALAHVQRAVKLAPQVALYHSNLGELLRLAGRTRLAVQEARRALELDPNMVDALSNLGVASNDLKDYEAAVDAQRKAIALKPDFAEAHGHLGNALHALRRFDEAIEAYRSVVALVPENVDGWANLGTTLHHGGQFDEAMVTLRRAIALAPGHANAHSGLGILLLMRGDLGEGWDEYEWRLRSSERKGPRFPEKPWEGESLAGKHIYVQAEQGFGDSLQFARYVPLLAARAGGVTLRVHHTLVGLLRESLPGIAVLGDRGKPAPYACDTLLLSLPRLFKTRLETIPADVPYLRPSAAAIERWKKRLAKLPGLKIGVAWAGNPEHINDGRRSIPLQKFEPLFAARGVSFASLQIGPPAADLKKLKRGKTSVEDLSAALEDFMETAGAVSALDLVITADTSVAHLTGALGKPVWLLLPWVADWRWMFHREDSPWYPTMRLFRQKKGEDWSAVIGRVASEIKKVVGGKTAALMPFEAEGQRRAVQAAAIIAAQAASAAAPAVEEVQGTAPGYALIVAEQKRRRGLLADADDLARRAVDADPANAEAVHMLGIIAHQSGKAAEAIEHLRRAISLKPDVALYHANLCEMCRLAGRIDEAVAAGRRAIALNANYAVGLSNLGIALFEQGKFEEALTHYDRALALQDDFAQAHSNRGNALQRLKRFAEAEPAYRRALQLQPNFRDAWNNLGTCLREMRRPEEAEQIYRKALELARDDPDTLDNLALALKELNRLDEAADVMRRVLAIESTRDKFHLHYGNILIDQDRIEEAKAATERALALNPKNHDALNQMGRIASTRGELNTALDYCHRALALKPDFADAHNNLGNVLKEFGHLHEAQQAYLEALRLDPNVAGVYVNLADSKIFRPGDPHLAAMEALAAKTEGLSQKERMELDFALGKAYADLHDHRRSFDHLRNGNAAKRATIAYDEKAIFAMFDRIERVFTRELIKAKSGGGDPSSMPVFIIGMPRSGTTLIEQIIASHPAAHGAGELQSFDDVIAAVRGRDGKPIPYPEFVPALDAAALRQIGARYIATVRDIISSPARGAANAAAERVTDKMPSNYYFAGLIHLALPNAKIIHIIRDPVDTCMSCFARLFSAEQNHTYGLAEIGRYYRRYERLMAHWHAVLPAARILDVRYEDVVADLEGTARRMLAHCGLAWDDRCLSFHETVRPVRTASASQVRQPIDGSAVGRWHVYEEHIGPLFEALGLAAAVRRKS